VAAHRESGILLHPTSLPGHYGIGEVGPSAYAFVDWLCRAGQHLWQILPLGPTSYGDSPYQSLSTFAGNPLLISFDLLLEDGLLAPSRAAQFPRFPGETVDFGAVIPARKQALGTVCRGFNQRAGPERRAAFDRFCAEQASWLDDYALFVALKEAHGLRAWTEWAPEYRNREAGALRRAGRKLQIAVRNAKLQQYLFFDHWHRLREYCARHSIRLIGDIPIFVAHDSSDVWAHRELFYIEDDGLPTVIAGVPPDYFSADGQRWGNPLYRWEVHEETGYSWWIERMRSVFDLVDIVRIDHFRGFEAYWEIAAAEETAIHGRWVPGPKHRIFEALEGALGDLPIIAEDLGVITPEVEALRDRFGFPGMRVLQFAFGSDPMAEDYRPEAFPGNTVCYTGTHDNDTTRGWFWSEAGKGSTRSREEIESERRTILEYVGTDGTEIHWDLISVAAHSPADRAIYPLQDLLGLDTSGRMNVPGEPAGNWGWRFRPGQLTPELEQRIRAICASANRPDGREASEYCPFPEVSAL
jgi:4-alpha-glucanotransferase